MPRWDAPDHAWHGALPNPQWVYFGDANLDRVLYLALHEPNDITDEFWHFGEEGMTVKPASILFAVLAIDICLPWAATFAQDIPSTYFVIAEGISSQARQIGRIRFLSGGSGSLVDDRDPVPPA